MHHHCEVWIPERENAESQVEEAMKPHWEENGGFWDWYQIGGRWKGIHDPTYKQEEDQEHLIPCRYCDATGLREDMGHWEKGKKVFRDDWAEKCNGCNICHGTGIMLKWPTDWNPHPKDIVPIGEILEKLSCATLILPGEVLEDLQESVESTLKKKGIKDGYLVTVDYHS